MCSRNENWIYHFDVVNFGEATNVQVDNDDGGRICNGWNCKLKIHLLQSSLRKNNSYPFHWDLKVWFDCRTHLGPKCYRESSFLPHGSWSDLPIDETFVSKTYKTMVHFYNSYYHRFANFSSQEERRRQIKKNLVTFGAAFFVNGIFFPLKVLIFSKVAFDSCLEDTVSLRKHRYSL